MNERERTIRLWFDMWLQKKDLGISEIFLDNAVYIESWGPSIMDLQKSNFGSMNGIPAARFFNGILNNFFIKGKSNYCRMVFQKQNE